MNSITRRTFLKQTAATAATLSLPWTWSRASGANDTIRAAVIGFNGRGASHIEGLRKIPGVKIVALCDVDDKVREHAISAFDKRGEKVQGYKDVRKLLENKDIDVITTATPNHWHSLITIWACQAGKDVYCEKPVSHNIWEGRQMVKAAAKYNRIVQAGTQSRSSSGIREAVEFVRKGNLGKIKLARGLCYKPRPSIGRLEGNPQIPAEIGEDGFNLWCGPREKMVPHRIKLHYDWHWFWATGNGDLGNQGVHQVDIARWFLGEQELAPRVLSVGGRLGYEDDGETANTQILLLEYDKAPLFFEVRGLPSKTGTKDMDRYWPVPFTPPPAAPEEVAASTDKKKGKKRGATESDPRPSIGVVIHCENGFVSVPGYTGAVVWDNDGKKVQEFKGVDDHFENFIKAVRSRKNSDLNAQVLEGHLSAGLCHQGNISYRLGQRVPPDETRERLAGDKEALETYGRMQAHLEANGVDLKKTPTAIGPWLKFDPKAERFVDNDAANAMVKEKYRAPFVVPDEV
jgi:predicted dehydrogenase